LGEFFDLGRIGTFERHKDVPAIVSSVVSSMAMFSC